MKSDLRVWICMLPICVFTAPATHQLLVKVVQGHHLLANICNYQTKVVEFAFFILPVVTFMSIFIGLFALAF